MRASGVFYETRETRPERSPRRAQVVKYLASLGADMEIPIHDGATPIFIACYRGNMDIVRFLCSQMVNLETPNANGNTPFAIASQHRRLDIAEVLLQHGVNIAPVNKKGSTPFFFACQEGNLDVVRGPRGDSGPFRGSSADEEHSPWRRVAATPRPRRG